MKKIFHILLVTIFVFIVNCGGAITESLLTGSQGGGLSGGFNNADQEIDESGESNFDDDSNDTDSYGVGGDDYVVTTDGEGSSTTSSTQRRSASGLTAEEGEGDNYESITNTEGVAMTGPTTAKYDGESCESYEQGSVTTLNSTFIMHYFAAFDQSAQDDGSEQSIPKIYAMQLKKSGKSDSTSSNPLLDSMEKFEVSRIGMRNLSEDQSDSLFRVISANKYTDFFSDSSKDSSGSDKVTRPGWMSLEGSMDDLPDECPVIEIDEETGEEYVASYKNIYEVMDIKMQVTRITSEGEVFSEIVDITSKDFSYIPKKVQSGDMLTFTIYNSYSDADENGSDTLQLAMNEDLKSVALSFLDPSEVSNFLKLNFAPKESVEDDLPTKVSPKFLVKKESGEILRAKPVFKSLPTGKKIRGFDFDLDDKGAKVRILELK